MSKCGRTAQLEFAAELTPELEAHAERCASCAHELDWRRTEQALFSQRRARQAARTLPIPMPRPMAPPAPSPVQAISASTASDASKVVALPARATTARAEKSRSLWSPVALALAASLLLALGLGITQPPSALGNRPAGERDVTDSMSLQLSSFGTAQPNTCSELEPGTGFVCEPVVLASFR